MSEEKLKILLVDDEPRVLSALDRHLRDNYQVLMAESGAAGVQLLTQNEDVAIIISDMRMPEMDGAAFLQQAHSLRPNAVRILLTGHADVQAAVRAINQGQIFRFLTKPCAPDDLSAVLREAQRQYELLMAERTLLQRTLLGCVKALMDMMAFANPEAMGHAVRLKRRVSAIAKAMDLDHRWQAEAAAMFSQLGRLSLSEQLLHKLDGLGQLDATEQEEVDSATRAASHLIAQVPRLEAVSRILNIALGLVSDEPIDSAERRLVETLQFAIAIEEQESAGLAADAAIDLALKLKTFTFAQELKKAAKQVIVQSHEGTQRASISVQDLRIGMVLDEDMSARNGILIAPRGCEVTESFLLHIKGFREQVDQKTIKIIERQQRTTKELSRTA